VIIRAIFAIAFAWLVMPRQSDPGPDSNNRISTASFATPACAVFLMGECAELNSRSGIGASGTLERLRGTLLERIDSVRVDLRNHRSHSDGIFAASDESE
jgi:hypothetical protein